MVLWDTVCLGLFENFIFNSARQRVVTANRFSMYPGVSPAAKLMSAWDWSKQFSEEELTLFNNPLYITMQLKGFAPRVVSNGNRNLYRMNLGDHHDNSIAVQDAVVLRPDISISCLQFWSYCYLRWLTPVEIIGGGTPSVYIQQCFLVEEIICLQHKIDSLEKSTQFVKSRRPKSDLFFGFECNPSVNARKWNKVLTSSFPFVPDTHRNSGAPISLYVETSSLCESDDSLDDLSEDDVGETSQQDQNHTDVSPAGDESQNIANDVAENIDNLLKLDVASLGKIKIQSPSRVVSPKRNAGAELCGSMLPSSGPYKVSDGHIVYADSSPAAVAQTNVGKSPVKQPWTPVPLGKVPLGDVGPLSDEERSGSREQGHRKQSVDNLFSYLGWQS